jgi:uncharacterized protein YecE (DUF72 family)
MSEPPAPQSTLFELAESPIEAVAPNPAEVSLAAQLPRELYFGGMTWSYPGWAGVVYARTHSEKVLAARGLSAYARKPLLRVVEIDRTYYQPLAAADLHDYAAQVPAEFKFLVKAHEACTIARYPEHARYGRSRGQDNPLFLDPDYASRVVIEPLVGLGTKLFGLLFQFSPQGPLPPREFPERLHAFLSRLPRGVTYAVELRDAALLTSEYAAALAATGAIHCHNAWTFMPSVLEQAKRLSPPSRRPLLLRWLLKRNHRYEQAKQRFAPFSRIVEADLGTRNEVASLVRKALASGVSACVLVDNKAEGCAPESIVELARAIVAPALTRV